MKILVLDTEYPLSVHVPSSVILDTSPERYNMLGFVIIPLYLVEYEPKSRILKTPGTDMKGGFDSVSRT